MTNRRSFIKRAAGAIAALVAAPIALKASPRTDFAIGPGARSTWGYHAVFEFDQLKGHVPRKGPEWDKFCERFGREIDELMFKELSKP